MLHEQKKLLVNVRFVNFNRIFKLIDQTINAFFQICDFGNIANIYSSAFFSTEECFRASLYLFHQLLVSNTCTQIVSILMADAYFMKNKHKKKLP